MNKDQRDSFQSRRDFICGGALLGMASYLFNPSSVFASGARPRKENAVLNSERPDAPYTLNDAESVLHTACLQCNTGCGIKCKVQNGVVTKIDGNPYNPWTLLPHLPYATSLTDAVRVDGSVCPKGQAGLQTAYDPYRIRKVLKRAGKRGENQWVTIPFDQAVSEIVEGGKLFSSVSGEEGREVEGLRSILTLRDNAVAKAMAEDVKIILDEKDAVKKKSLVEEFKVKHAAHLDHLIDPEHPDLGPKNNQFVIAWGRLKGGRGEFYKRFASACGTTNAHGHTTVCQGSLYFTCKAISEQYVAGKFSGGDKFYWQADTENSRFILFVGANLFEANYGPPNRTVRLTENLVQGRTKIATADPRYSKLASKSWRWLPLQPGSDSALALAMIRWILDENRYDAGFLRNANKAAAKLANEPSWSNATWLVEVKDGKPGKFARASDFGLAKVEKRSISDPKDKTKTLDYEEPFMIIMQDGKPVAVDPNDTTTPMVGDLFVDTEITANDGKKVKVKSSLQILAESAREKTVAEWATMTGVSEKHIVEVARELTSYGKAVAVDIHRGPAQHTNGFYNVLAWMSLNMLLGNFDHRGGLIKASTYDTVGKKGGPFAIEEHPGKPKTFGISSIRHDVKYEQTTLFEGYPAKRNWYPLSSDVYEEIIPSIGDAYPYPIKALLLYMGAPTYALPAGHTNIEILRDTEKLPLFISNDILVGSTSMYADYIFPDLSFLERWEFQGSHPNIPNKVQPVRQPVMAPIPELCQVFGEEMPMSLEALLLGVAEKLKLKGFGKNAFGEGLDLTHPDHLYLRCVANLAHGEAADGSKAVPDANEREQSLFMKARVHLPKSVFDAERWRSIVGDALWPKVITVLNRGGRFEDHAKAYTNDGLVTHAYAKLLNMYQEKTAGVKHSGTGKSLAGYACYIPVQDFHGKEPVELRKDYNLQLITHRTITQTKSRTITNPWLTPIMPENAILLHPDDASAQGLKNGDAVRVVSATNKEGVWPLGDKYDKPMIGHVVLTQTIRPGVTSFALGFGHWATGASDMVIDGYRIRGEKRRQAGVHANAAMWVDPTLKNTCFLDPVGGSVSFYDTHIRLEKVSNDLAPAPVGILKAT